MELMHKVVVSCTCRCVLYQLILMLQKESGRPCGQMPLVFLISILFASSTINHRISQSDPFDQTLPGQGHLNCIFVCVQGALYLYLADGGWGGHSKMMPCVHNLPLLGKRCEDTLAVTVETDNNTEIIRGKQRKYNKKLTKTKTTNEVMKSNHPHPEVHRGSDVMK